MIWAPTLFGTQFLGLDLALWVQVKLEKMQTDFILTCVAHDIQAVGDVGDKLFRSSLKHTQL